MECLAIFPVSDDDDDGTPASTTTPSWVAGAHASSTYRAGPNDPIIVIYVTTTLLPEL